MALTGVGNNTFIVDVIFSPFILEFVPQVNVNSNVGSLVATILLIAEEGVVVLLLLVVAMVLCVFISPQYSAAVLSLKLLSINLILT